MTQAELDDVTQVLQSWARGQWSRNGSTPEAQKILTAAREALAAARAEDSARIKLLEDGIDAAADTLVRIAIQGDLTSSVEVPSPDAALLALFGAVNQSAQILREFVVGLRTAIGEIAHGTRDTHSLLEHTEQMLTNQAGTSREMAAALAELKGTSVEIERSAETVAQLAQQAFTASQNGSSAVQEFSPLMAKVRISAGSVNESVNKLSKAVQQVTVVMELISEVADRSDILALNAALEAARAGEAGEGFAIVAEEMRRLSSRVLANTTEVSKLIEGIRSATIQVRLQVEENVATAQLGERKARQTLDALSGVDLAVKDTTDAALNIQMATQQQRSATTQAAQAVSELSEEARRALESSKATRTASGALYKLSDSLSELVRRFTIGD